MVLVLDPWTQELVEDAPEQFLEGLTERERQVWDLRFMQTDATHKEVGALIGVTPTRVRQIEQQLIVKLRRCSRECNVFYVLKWRRPDGSDSGVCGYYLDEAQAQVEMRWCDGLWMGTPAEFDVEKARFEEPRVWFE